MAGHEGSPVRAGARLVLDLDTGVDDALALALALASPEVELVAVIASYGNVTTELAARNALSVLRLLGHPEVPVYLGSDRPLVARGPFSPAPGVVRIHGANGLGGQPFPEPAAHARPGGVGLLANLAAEFGPGVRYVPTGTLTDLALALALRGELAEELGRVTLMGGALAVAGNVTRAAEANVHNDPEAADAVFRSGPPTRMVGLDVTHQVVLTREDTARWRALGTEAGKLFADMTDAYIATYERNNPLMGGCALHDPLAVAAALDPSLVRCLGANLMVELEGPGRGRTLCSPEGLREPHKRTEVSLGVDAPRFLELFRMRMLAALGA